MKIKNALFVRGYSAFYFDDQLAVKTGAQQDGFVFAGKPKTEGFASVRQPGESISILLELENGLIAKGDCSAVQYSGAAGRDPIFISDSYIGFLEECIRPKLIGLEVSFFRENSEFFDELVINGQRMHTALRYGVSQALLDATAISSGRLKSEVICHEYDLPINVERIKLFGQSGDDRHLAVDKMIAKRVDTLPHALINTPEKLGAGGAGLTDYIIWLKKRIDTWRVDKDYRPNIHIDVYGTIGNLFQLNASKIANYIDYLQSLSGEYQLYIEGPVDAGNKRHQIKLLRDIKDELSVLNSKAKIVADEWCNSLKDIVDFVDTKCCHMVQIKTPELGAIHNTVEAVLYCKENGVESYQGGTCNETELSAQSCTHIGMAVKPDLMLIKPGMGFDEGMTIVSNEMNRVEELLKSRYSEKQLVGY